MDAAHPVPPTVAATEAADADGGPAFRMLQAWWGFSLLATVVGVGRHIADALALRMPAEGGLAERLGAIPTPAWLWAALHLLGALASLPIGYRVIAWAYPGRGAGFDPARNPAAAVQASAHLVGASVISVVSWGGSDGFSLLVSAVFAALGWLAVIAIVAAHRLVTTYHDHEEVAAGNVAAAIASAGLHVAVAIVVGRAIQGQFIGWSDSLVQFGLALLWVLALWPLRQVVLARLVLRMTPREMDGAVSVRRDPWLGVSEAVCYVLSALCLSAGW